MSALPLPEVPGFLRFQSRWCQWKAVENAKGKKTKQPHSPTSTKAVDQLHDWVEVKDLPRDKERGIGFVLTGGVLVTSSDGRRGWLIALDLDACRCPRTGVIEQWAMLIVVHYDSYTEITPSETGLRIWLIIEELPKAIHSKVTIDAPAPAGVTKKPELQLFGLGSAGYVTVSGDRGTEQKDARWHKDLSWLIDQHKLRASDRPMDLLELPIGRGTPPSANVIEDYVRSCAHGLALINGDWQTVLPRKSASDVYWILVQRVLEGAEGHGRAAVDFLLNLTAWGKGLIHDSVDPMKYTREDWVWSEVARCSAKTTSALTPGDVFEPVAEPVEADPDRFRIYHMDEVADWPDQPDVWAEMMPRGSLTVWYGSPKCGKSYLAISLMVAIIEGKAFLGRETLPARGTVLYVAGEGVKGMRNKIAAAVGLDRMRDPKAFRPHFGLLPNMPNFTSKEDVKKVLAWLQKTGLKPDLIVVDTVARALGRAGLDENSTSDMGAFIDALDELRRVTGVAVLGVHHAGKAGTDRGSSALRAAADVVARIERGPDRAPLFASLFTMEDVRDGEPPAPIEVTWGRRLIETRGRARWRWYVLTHKDLSPGAVAQSERQQLEALFESSATLSKAEVQEMLGWGKTKVWKMLRELCADGRIKLQGAGRTTVYVKSSAAAVFADESADDSGSESSVRPSSLQGDDGGRSEGTEAEDLLS